MNKIARSSYVIGDVHDDVPILRAKCCGRDARCASSLIVNAVQAANSCRSRFAKMRVNCVDWQQGLKMATYLIGRSGNRMKQ
jgi:hypothetical protein